MLRPTDVAGWRSIKSEVPTCGHIDSKVGPIDISEGVAMLRMLGKAR